MKKEDFAREFLIYLGLFYGSILFTSLVLVLISIPGMHVHITYLKFEWNILKVPVK